MGAITLTKPQRRTSRGAEVWVGTEQNLNGNQTTDFYFPVPVEVFSIQAKFSSIATMQANLHEYGVLVYVENESADILQQSMGILRPVFDISAALECRPENPLDVPREAILRVQYIEIDTNATPTVDSNWSIETRNPLNFRRGLQV